MAGFLPLLMLTVPLVLLSWLGQVHLGSPTPPEAIVDVRLQCFEEARAQSHVTMEDSTEVRKTAYVACTRRKGVWP